MGGIGKTWKKIDPVGRMITDKNFAKNFWKHNPMYQTHLLAGKAGFKSPIYLMGEEKRGLGRAIELSGDPGQRFIRGKIRDWAMDSGLAKSAPPKYTSLPKTNIPQFQPMDNSGMIQNFITQQQTGNEALVAQKAGNIAAANTAQQNNINLGLAQNATGMGFKIPVKTTFTPANNFSSPNLSGLTFGGK